MKKQTALILCILMVLILSVSACSSYDGGYDYTPPPPSEDSASDGGWEPSSPSGDSYAGEQYLAITENLQTLTSEESLLTFSLKVDTASYSNVQRYLESGNLPPANAVKTEELINYFSYDSAMRFDNDSPFAVYTEIGPSPFAADRYLAFVRVRTEEIDKSELPPTNLTFLIDTSGSMSSYDKLPLLKEAFALLVETLDEDDTVSIVTYAGNADVYLDGVSGADKHVLLDAIDRLSAGGSTAGASGIMTAYSLAEKNFREGGNNRIILASDGDFNVGISSLDALEELVAEKRQSGVYLSVLGFGTGNIRDDIMETLAMHGNGNYNYINSLSTAEKVFVDELASNLFTVADDVKAQIEFNPANVKSYRLLGYENRALDNRDFANDDVDAGEIGVGTDVVIMFELELYGDSTAVDLKYTDTPQAVPVSTSSGEYADELLEVRIRYKNPGEDSSQLLIYPVTYDSLAASNSSDFGFASAVAAFGHLLRESEYAQSLTVEQIMALAESNLGRDEKGYRQEFLDLLQQYRWIVR